jgi:hypothetical protein
MKFADKKIIYSHRVCLNMSNVSNMSNAYTNCCPKLWKELHLRALKYNNHIM